MSISVIPRVVRRESPCGLYAIMVRVGQRAQGAPGGYREEGMRSVPSRIRLGSIHYASAFPHVACALAEIHRFGYGMIVPRTAVCGQHLNHLYTKNAHYPGHVLGYILLVRSLYIFSRIHLHLSMYVLRAHISVVQYNYIKCTSYFHNI